jgi:hypothetical protein
MLLKDGMCHRYFLKDKHMQILYFFSSDNELDLEIIPAYLLALMQVEEIVITWSYV